MQEVASNDNSARGGQFYDSARACRLAAGNYDTWTAGVLRRHARLQETRGRQLSSGVTVGPCDEARAHATDARAG